MAIDISKCLVQEAHRLMLNYDPEPTHAEQVCRLAVQLFDGVHAHLGLPGETLALLEAAALTHDIGWSIGGRGHHKKSARIIMENRLGTASHREVLVVAALARAHRKNPPAPPHKPFISLDPDDQIMVRKLASILRIADGLDRSHAAVVETVEVRVIDTQQMVVELACHRQPDIELFGLGKKKPLLEEILGMRIRGEVRDA